MTIKEYWNLIDQEPFLALTWEPDFSQACSLCRMLMKHKNFWFTQSPDKTNDVIFLKSPKTLFWGHFWSFSSLRDFFQKIYLSHTTSNAMLSFRKNSEPILRKFKTDGRMDGRTEGRMDRQTLFYRTLLAEAGGPMKRYAVIILEEK